MFKDILIHLHGTAADDAILAVGLEAAKLFDAHMECLHITPDIGALVARQGEPLMDTVGLVASALDVLEAEAKKRSKAAREAYSKFVRENELVRAEAPLPGSGPSIAWREASGEPTDRLIAAARVHDLVVTASGPEESVVLYYDIGRLVLGAGKPILLAPQKSLQPNRFRTVAIAWKDSAEAARAVTVAMPILCKAHNVIVFSANEDDRKANECLECNDNLADQLHWHDIAVQCRYVIPAGRTPADAVIESARQAGADLLVMGGYGHSRLRELIFGGFTRRVLEDVTLPVFIFH